MKSRTFIKTISCVGILLCFSGIIQCQRGTGTRTAGTRMIGGGLRSRTPGMRLRTTGATATGQIANQTTSRRGSPRLLGFILPSSNGGRPQLRLMPGAQDFIRPGRRIAAAPLSQLSRLGGSRTSPGRGMGRGSNTGRTMTGLPSNLIGRTQARTGVRGATRAGQIRTLPQSALNTISAAARGRPQARQPNIVFVRPPSRTRTSGLSPDMVRRIRLAALQRAAAQRGATVGRTGINRNTAMTRQGISRNAVQPIAGMNRNAVQIRPGISRNAMLTTLNRNAVRPQSNRSPQSVNRAPQSTIRRTDTRTRTLPDATMVRRMNALNAARGRGNVPPRQVRPVSQMPTETTIRRITPRRPARVDEAVLRANIVPAGLSPLPDGVRRVVSSSSSSNTESTTTSTTSSSSERRVTSSGTGPIGVGGIMQTGIQGVQPVPELQFRTAIGDKPAATIVAPEIKGTSGGIPAGPVLDAGPPFQVLSGNEQSIIFGPGTSVAESVSLDVGAASGPALAVSPTVIASGDPMGTLATAGASVAAIAPIEEATIVQGGAAFPIEDPTIVAAAAGPSAASIVPVASDTSVISSALPILNAVNGADAQLVPTLGTAEISGVGTVVPGQALGPSIISNGPTTLAKSNPDMNSLKSVITDVLRDMAVNGKSSSVQPDISAMARAVLQAQESKVTSEPQRKTQKTKDNSSRKPIIQTFTLTPTNPSVIINADSVDLLHPTHSGHHHNDSSFFDSTGLNTNSLHTAKPAITIHPMATDASHSHLADNFHTSSPHVHESAHDHVHSHSNHDVQGHSHHAPLVPEINHSHVGFTKPSMPGQDTTVKVQPTTAAPGPTNAANDHLNVIVGDWTGAEKTLTAPPPPPKRDLALEHPQGHHHFQSHVHGFSEPSIPPPPPVSEIYPSIHPVNIPFANDSAMQLTLNEKHSVGHDAASNLNNNAGFVDTNVVNSNSQNAITGHSKHDPGLNHGPDFSANNRQAGVDGVSIAVPAASSGIDNINTIAIVNKLFDANMPQTIASVDVVPTADTSLPLPVNVIAEGPTLDTTKPIGEQLMKQLPVPQELVTALTGGTVDNNPVLPSESPNTILIQSNSQESNTQTQNVVNTDTIVQSDQSFSLNNVRDGLIVDTLPAGSGALGRMDPVPSSSNDQLSALSLDKLAMNIPNDILSAPRNTFDSTAQVSNAIDSTLGNLNTDPTVRKIATILPTSDPVSQLPLMTLDAKGFSAEGRFNTIQRGFNRTTRLSSKNGINVQVDLTPHSISETHSTNSQNTKHETRTANIQTDGSFLGSRLPVPPKGAGKGVILSDLSKQPFYDQTSLLGAFADVLPTQVRPEILPVDIPLPPPQANILMVPSDSVSSDSNSFLNDQQITAVQLPDIQQDPAVTFTSTFDVPATQVIDPAGPAISTDFVALENNPNWAVFDPSAVSSDINFADINPVINGIVQPGQEISFVNTNDIQFTNAFDVAPVPYEPLPDSPPSTANAPQDINASSAASETVETNAINNVGQLGAETAKGIVTSVTNNMPADQGLQFQEVMIAPLSSSTGNDLPGATVDLPPPPPIF